MINKYNSLSFEFRKLTKEEEREIGKVMEMYIRTRCVPIKYLNNVLGNQSEAVGILPIEQKEKGLEGNV